MNVRTRCALLTIAFCFTLLGSSGAHGSPLVPDPSTEIADVSVIEPGVSSALPVEAEVVDAKIVVGELSDGESYARNPVWVRVGDEATARLQDSQGFKIPFAADSNKDDGVVHLPSLIAGRYQLVDGDRLINFTVLLEQAELFDDRSLDSLSSQSNSPKVWLYVAVMMALVLGFVLVRRKQRILAVLITVTVTAGAFTVLPETPAPADVNTCLQIEELGDNQITCLLDRVLYLLGTNDGDATQARNELEQAGNIAACHEVAHELGRLTWLFGGYDAVAVPGPDNCDSGFYHGAMEAASVYLDDTAFEAFAKTFCGTVTAGTDRDQLAVCLHGLGHGGMYRYAGDLHKVIALCDDLGYDYFSEETCAGAGYMEHVRMMKAAETNDAYAPIPNIPTVELCASAPIEHAVHCYAGVVMNIPRTATSGPDLLKICDKVTTAAGHRLVCVDGVMREAVSHLLLGEQPEQPCLVLNGRIEQLICLTYVAQISEQRNPEVQAEEICTRAGVKETSLCTVEPTRYWNHLRRQPQADVAAPPPTTT
jgi:hypothetical protein